MNNHVSLYKKKKKKNILCLAAVSAALVSFVGGSVSEMTSAMTGVVWSVALGPKNTWRQQNVVGASVWIFLSYNSLIFNIQTGSTRAWVLLISAISCSKDSMTTWVHGTQIKKSKRILTVDSAFSSGLIPGQFRDPLTKILVVTCGCWGVRDAALNFRCTTIKWHPPDQLMMVKK